MRTFYSDEVPAELLDRPAQLASEGFDSRPSLCNDCERSSRGRCPWAQEGKPYPGWTAEPTVIKITPNAKMNSYRVTDCPGYAKAWEIIRIIYKHRAKHKSKLIMIRRYKQNPDQWSDEGVAALMEAALKSARSDYLTIPRDRKTIREWLLGLNFLSDPEGLIKELDKQARICDLHPELRRKMLLKGGLKGGETE